MRCCRVIVEGAPFVNEEGFSYKIPELLDQYIVRGSMVYVPFGKGDKIKTGFVIEVLEDEENEHRLKDVLMVQHLHPVISDDMMALCRFVADYYACALVYAIKQIVPKYVLNNAFVAFEDVKTGHVVKLKKTQLLEQIDRLKHGTYKLIAYEPLKDDSEKYYGLNLNESVIPDDWWKALKRAPKQKDILLCIDDRRIVSEQLLKESFGNIREPLQGLIEKGFVKEVAPLSFVNATTAENSLLKMTSQQERVFNSLNAQLEEGCYHKNLINGVTGSGKTLIYEKIAQKAIDRHQQVLILVPEIALSYHLFERLKGCFGERIGLLHSQLTERERYQIWKQVAAHEIDVVLGPRSALFLPYSDLGLIVIDEEHESSYKQSEPDPRYHAITVAEYLAKKHQAILVLGSATPSIDSLYDAVTKRSTIFNLTERANQAALPSVHIVDMTEERKIGNFGILSDSLREAMSQALEKKEQIILLINKKGYSSSIACHECGEVIHCPKCDIPLTYYQSTNELKCNYCEYHMPMVDCCPSCGSHFIDKHGIGTESVEELCAQYFPKARLARLDGQSMSNNKKREQILSQYEQHEIDILVGTQLLAKGLDFNNTTCIGVVNADITLNLPDFRSAERCFQLMVQVAGRAGRDHKPGKVFIQTYQKDHYAIKDACEQNIHQFFLDEIEFRKQWLYPPIVRLCRIIVSDYSLNDVEYSMKSIYNYIVNLPVKMEIIGPSFAPLSKKNNRYRMHMIIKTTCIEDGQDMMRGLRDHLKNLAVKKSSRVIIDIDPENIL